MQSGYGHSKMPPQPPIQVVPSSSSRQSSLNSSAHGVPRASANGSGQTPTRKTYLPPTEQELAEMSATKVTPELMNYIQKKEFPYIRDVNNYDKLQKVGQGTFGEVFKARCRKTHKIVALKKILMDNEKEGFPITALREVKMLQQLKHENITELIEVCGNTSSNTQSDRSLFYLVFTFCEHDLAGLLSNNKVKLTGSHSKTLMKHLLKGLAKLHRSKILHRDMKSANILLNKEGVLKLADFGLARTFFNDARHLYTNRVVTLWYRPPELLLGARSYTTAIDTWGAGCIMAELWTRTPVMQAETDQGQLDRISKLCGPINKEVWPDVEHLPLYKKMELPQSHRRVLVDRMQGIMKDPLGLSMLDRLLCLDPSKRLSAEAALDDTYFFSSPLPTETVKDLMDTIKTSQFEFTVGRGAHANRGRGSHQQRPAVQRSTNNNTHNQYHDMIF